MSIKKPANPGKKAKRILVIKLSALGDFMMAQGAIAEVRKAHPSAYITLLTTPPYKAFASASPYFDAVETDGRPPTINETVALIRRLRRCNYDMIYDFQTSKRTNRYFHFMNPNPPLWSGVASGCSHPHTNPDRASMHSIDRLAEQLTRAGIGPAEGYTEDQTPMPDFSWLERAMRHSPRLQPTYFGLKPQKYMLLIPGASAHRSAKRWPQSHYLDLIRILARSGITPVIIGSHAESEIARHMAKREPKVKNLVTRTDLFQLIGLSQNAAFAIGNDTGPMHIASLAGAPGIALFATSESDPDQARPRGSNIIVIQGQTLHEVSVIDVIYAIRALGVGIDI